MLNFDAFTCYPEKCEVKKELERQSWQIDALDKIVEREYVTWVITCHSSHEVLASKEK